MAGSNGQRAGNAAVRPANHRADASGLNSARPSKNAGRNVDRLRSAPNSAVRLQPEGIGTGSPARALRVPGRGGPRVAARKGRYLDTVREHLTAKQRKAKRAGIRMSVFWALRGCGRLQEALSLASCGRWFRVFRSKCGTERLLPCRCDHPLCPECARERSWPFQRRVLAKTRDKTKSYKFLTFTRVNVPFIDPAYVRSLTKQFAKLRKSPIWKRWITGGVHAVDTTYNRVESSWHVHLHVIVEVSHPAGSKVRGRPWLPDEWIFAVQQEWLRITGDSHVVNMRAVNLNAVKELVKYQAKVATFFFDPALVDEYLKAFKNARRIQCFGSFLDIKEPGSIEQAQHEQMSLWVCACGKCVFRGASKLSDWKETQRVGLEDTIVDGKGQVLLKPKPPSETDDVGIETFSLTEKTYQRTAQVRLGFDEFLPATQIEHPALPGF